MANSNSKTSSPAPKVIYDSIVIGGGLGGLLVANALERSGRNVALIEALDAMGGNCRALSGPLGAVDHGLKYFPNVPGSAEALAWVESLTGISSEAELVEAPPVTFDSGRFQPFVGFGDEALLSVDELVDYLAPEHWRLKRTPKDWTQDLARNFKGATFGQSVVTKIELVGGSGGGATEITVNGAKRFAANEYFVCTPPSALVEMIGTEGHPVAARLKQRLQRGAALTSIHLDLIHGAPVTDSLAPHILKGANEEPVVGLFSPAQEGPGGALLQRSQWIVFVAAEQTDDSELVASMLKYVKRQIKRAYESSLDGLVHERILVCPQSHGSTPGVLGEGRLWPKTRNLRGVSSLFADRRGLLGLIAECQAATAHADAVPKPVEAVPEHAPEPNAEL